MAATAGRPRSMARISAAMSGRRTRRRSARTVAGRRIRAANAAVSSPSGSGTVAPSPACFPRKTPPPSSSRSGLPRAPRFTPTKHLRGTPCMPISRCTGSTTRWPTASMAPAPIRRRASSRGSARDRALSPHLGPLPAPLCPGSRLPRGSPPHQQRRTVVTRGVAGHQEQAVGGLLRLLAAQPRRGMIRAAPATPPSSLRRPSPPGPPPAA